MSPSEIVNTAEMHVYERALYKVGSWALHAYIPHGAVLCCFGFRCDGICCYPLPSYPKHPFAQSRPPPPHTHMPPQMPERRPHPNGVLDPRLGISNKRSICETCGQGLADCTGHFGHIHLELPVFHIGYFKNTVQILQAICKTCSRVLVSDEERRRTLRWVPSGGYATCMHACIHMPMTGTIRAAALRLAMCRCIRMAGVGDGAAVGCGGLGWEGGAYAGACCPSSLAVSGAMPKRVEAETLPDS